MRKVSELIRLAVTNPAYLNGNEDQHPHTGFLCNVVDLMPFTKVEKRAVHDTIKGVVGVRHNTLFGHMTDNYQPIASIPHTDNARRALRDTIHSSTPRQPNDLRVQFWAVLCMDLVRKGL